VTSDFNDFQRIPKDNKIFYYDFQRISKEQIGLYNNVQKKKEKQGIHKHFK
jgi:hypothetical protein